MGSCSSRGIAGHHTAATSRRTPDGVAGYHAVQGVPYDHFEEDNAVHRVVSAENVLKQSGWYKRIHAGHKERPFRAAPLQGNIYRYWAITWAGKSKGSWAFSCCVWRSWAGLVAVMMVQILGPIAMLINATQELDFSSCSVVVIGSKEDGWTKILARSLSTLLLYGFIAKSYNTLEEEELADKKMHVLFIRMYNMNAFVFYKSWILIGAAINCWVSVSSCIAMWFIFQSTDSPTDVLFNALSLTFLVNLDNVSGEMGVISESHWNETWIGDFWHDLMKIPMVSPAGECLSAPVDDVRRQMLREKQKQKPGEDSEDKLDHIIQTEEFVKKVLEYPEIGGNGKPPNQTKTAEPMMEMHPIVEAHMVEAHMEEANKGKIEAGLKRGELSYRALSNMYNFSKFLLQLFLLMLPLSFIFISLKENDDN